MSQVYNTYKHFKQEESYLTTKSTHIQVPIYHRTNQLVFLFFHTYRKIVTYTNIQIKK